MAVTRSRACASPECEGSSSRTPLCTECLTQAAREIRALPGDYEQLGQELTPAHRGMTARVACTEDGSALIALGIEALRRSIFWALTVWEPPVREAAKLPRERTRGVREHWAVSAASFVLTSRIDFLANLGPTWGYAEGLDAGPVQHDGLWAIEHLRRLHQQARTACGITHRTFHLPGDCPRCGAQALLRADGSDTICCGNCGQERAYEDYEQYVTLALAQLGVA
jgi:hypothetical protein